MELYAIVGAAQGDVLWAGLASPADAEELAVKYALGFGNVNLLSGEDLALHLLGGAGRLSPTHALERTWKPGERVELCSGGYGGKRRSYRPGTVDRIERPYGYHEPLVVAFDDGETTAINPDVMRHVREKERA